MYIYSITAKPILINCIHILYCIKYIFLFFFYLLHNFMSYILTILPGAETILHWKSGYIGLCPKRIIHHQTMADGFSDWSQCDTLLSNGSLRGARPPKLWHYVLSQVVPLVFCLLKSLCVLLCYFTLCSPWWSCSRWHHSGEAGWEGWRAGTEGRRSCGWSRWTP